MFGEMDGKTKRGGPPKEWAEDTIQWCQADQHTLQQTAIIREKND